MLCLIGTTSAFICQRAAADSVPLRPTRKAVFGWVVTAGYIKKRVNRDSSKLDPVIFTLFFSLLRVPGRHSCPGARSKLKQGLMLIGASLLAAVSVTPLFQTTAATIMPPTTATTAFFVTFLDSKKVTSFSFVFPFAPLTPLSQTLPDSAACPHPAPFCRLQSMPAAAAELRR